jgi:hypothetical protein
MFKIPFFRPKKLFDGHDTLFKNTIATAKIYAEYGCGASTIWVANNTNCDIYSVDSSKKWLAIVQEKITRLNSVNLHWADVGEIKAWGRPLNYEKFDNFNSYTDWFWSKNISPDVVLIDGRFRVCCFLTSLLHANEGTFLIFDDYADSKRTHYWFVERFIKPVRTFGRQALFVVPNKNTLDLDLLKKSIESFRCVFE